MPNYITTYGGTHFYPTEPRREDLHITDIAHALSLICRGNGHVKTFFSVAQHCIACAKEAEARGESSFVCLLALLHDASECYLSDVPRPFKEMLPAYRELEDKLLEIIYTHYLGRLPNEEEAAVLKTIDDDLLYFDLRDLLSEEPGRDIPEIHISEFQKFRPFEEVENEYLELFEKYFSALEERSL